MKNTRNSMSEVLCFPEVSSVPEFAADRQPTVFRYGSSECHLTASGVSKAKYAAIAIT